jgi:hypothetical protein
LTRKLAKSAKIMQVNTETDGSQFVVLTPLAMSDLWRNLLHDVEAP